MKKETRKVLGIVRTVALLIVFGVCLFCVFFVEGPGSLISAKAEAREQAKEQTWEEEVEEAEAKWEYSAFKDIHYFYDPEVDICYAIVVHQDSYRKAVGLTVVPYEKVKDRAIVIGTPKD